MSLTKRTLLKIIVLGDSGYGIRQAKERYRSVGSALYRGTNACVLVYNVHSIKSFDALDKWHAEFLKMIYPKDPNSLTIILLGNKIDIDGGLSRVVSEERAKEWCTSKEISFILKHQQKRISVLIMHFSLLPELAMLMRLSRKRKYIS